MSNNAENLGRPVDIRAAHQEMLDLVEGMVSSSRPLAGGTSTSRNVAGAGTSAETTSRRRSPDATNANASASASAGASASSRSQSDEPSVVVDLGSDSDPPTAGSNRDRALASFMANFFPSITSSGSGVRTGASNVSTRLNRALNNLAQSNDSDPPGERRNSSRRGPLQLRSIFSEWRSSNSDLSSDSDGEDFSAGRRARRLRSVRRSASAAAASAATTASSATASRLPNRSDSTQTNSLNVANATETNGNGSFSAENTGADPNSEATESNDAEDGGSAGDANANSPRSLLRTILPLMSKGVPFLLLIFVKVLWEHSLGILVMLGLSLTFWHANKMLKNQVSLKERRSLVVLAWIVVFLTSDVYLIFLVFQSQELGNALILLDTKIDEASFGLWHLLWVAGITDFVVRFGAITLKSIVVALPRKWLPYKYRGKYYLLIETLSNMYRQLTPIRPWLLYLWGSESDNQILGGILVVLYSLLKLNTLRIAIQEGYTSLKAVRRDTSYGTVPSASALKDACAESGGDEKAGCPICQEEFNEPIELSCKHIFCEECVSMWFDRERTCPLCRATIADDPKWRDGSTSYAMQLY